MQPRYTYVPASLAFCGAISIIIEKFRTTVDRQRHRIVNQVQELNKMSEIQFYDELKQKLADVRSPGK